MCVDVSADFSPDGRYRSDALKLIAIIQVMGEGREERGEGREERGKGTNE